jgi:ABC-2 type transport system permease protein
MNFNKIKLIISREYLTRVRKRSFLIMTLLGPILFAGITILPAWLSSVEDHEIKRIAVIDSSHLFLNKIPQTEVLKFEYLQGKDLETVKKTFKKDGYYAILFIPHIVSYSPDAVEMFSDKQPSWSVKSHITDALSKELENQKLKTYNIDNLDNILKSVKTNVNIRSIQISEQGGEKENNVELNMVLGYLGGFLMYMLIFMFGAQIMRGVIEEKTSRIVEVIVSSVRPFELMMGKIIGVSLVGLTQFVIWIVLTLGIMFGVQKAIFPEVSKTATEQVVSNDVMKKADAKTLETTTQQTQKVTQAAPMDEKSAKVKEVFDSLGRINAVSIIGAFLFYFLGGYLLYASLFAAIGSAVDSETDTQQFMLPITIPLILAIVVMGNAIQNPDGQMAFWFSIIPLTSPIVMMVRVPFGVPWWQVGISAALLVVTFVFTTWLAAKIYRTGILMYGKKASFKEMLKWARYKN